MMHHTKAEIQKWKLSGTMNMPCTALSDDWLELHAENDRLREAAAAVVDILRTIGEEEPPHDTWIAELGVAIDNLRIAAGIPAPPADETHDPDRDGDRRPENDR